MSLEDAATWARANGNRVRQAAKMHGVKVADLRKHMDSAKPGPKGKPFARAHADVRAYVHAREDVDPAELASVAFWERELRTCEQMRSGTDDQRGQREWTIQVRYARQELERCRAAHAEDEARRKASEVRNPVELAERLLKQAPALCHLAPEVARQVYEEMGRALGRLEE